MPERYSPIPEVFRGIKTTFDKLNETAVTLPEIDTSDLAQWKRKLNELLSREVELDPQALKRRIHSALPFNRLFFAACIGLASFFATPSISPVEEPIPGIQYIDIGVPAVKDLQPCDVGQIVDGKGNPVESFMFVGRTQVQGDNKAVVAIETYAGNELVLVDNIGDGSHPISQYHWQKQPPLPPGYKGNEIFGYKIFRPLLSDSRQCQVPQLNK